MNRLRQAPPSLREADAKAAVLQALRQHRQIDRHTVVANEFSLGRVGVRADLALFTRNQLIGVEVKTDADSLKRLERQLTGYRRYFDRIVLVVGDRHLQRLRQMEMSDLEVWRFTSTSEVEIVQEQAIQPYPDCRVDLLTQDERVRAARRAAKDEALHAIATHLLSERFKRTSEEFWRTVGRGRIQKSHLGCLSRFESGRLAVETHRAEQSAFWSTWDAAFDELANPQRAKSVDPLLVGV